MNKLIILTGLSCTLKSSITEVLVQDYGCISFPDVNREYVKCLSDVATVPSLVDTTGKIPNIMLVANRLNIYRTVFNVLKTEGEDRTFVINRTILEHLFFDNSDMLTTVDKESLIKVELEFLSQFDEVVTVLIENSSIDMLTKFYLTEEIRVGITKRSDKLDAYNDMKSPYKRFIEQLRPIDMVLNLDDNNTKDLSSTTRGFADAISRLINK